MSDDKENATDIGVIRQELKQWEKNFIAANGGRKPGRDDIKKNTDISAKYKEYDRLRRPAKEPGSPRSRPKHEDRSLQERSANALTSTPRKTPSKRKLSVSNVAFFSPAREIEPTPAFIRCALGPTPQKDGQVLGIFDMLSTGTPSRNRPSSVLIPAVATVPETPSKPLAQSDLTLSRTPQSAAKRSMLDAFTSTPLKRKRDDEDNCPVTGKRQFATPSFLRRSFPLGPIDEDSTEQAEYAPPFRKRGVVRSLSSIIQGLRRQEEERMDDEWDILNELEDEQQGNPNRTKEKPKIIVEDSQAIEMPLGPDRAPESDDEASNADETTGGFVRKPWKKKGLKRQTKRVIMRPVVHKPGKVSTIEEESGDEGEANEGISAGALKVSENGDPEPSDDASSTLDEEDDQSSAKEKKNQRKKSASVKAKQAKATAAAAAASSSGKDGNTLSKGIRKIGAQAHANFRRLKIKSKNSKSNGRGGGGRRFGKR